MLLSHGEEVPLCVQAHNVQASKERMQAQESEISALRRQLESMQVAASHARAGGAGRRQYDGSVPAEYICPITQVGALSAVCINNIISWTFKEAEEHVQQV